MTDPENKPLDAIYDRTRSVYDRNAEDWARRRNKSLFEAGWLDRFLSHVPQAGHVLDLGCGSGDPISKYMLARGRSVTGVDYAPAMIALAKAAFPQATWLVQDLCTLDLAQRFDGILSWDGTFHLRPDEQRTLIAKLSAQMVQGAPLLLTIGPEAGEVTGTIEGEPVYHASLSPDEYQACLGEHGFDAIEIVANDHSVGGHSILFALKS